VGQGYMKKRVVTHRSKQTKKRGGKEEATFFIYMGKGNEIKRKSRFTRRPKHLICKSLGREEIPAD